MKDLSLLPRDLAGEGAMDCCVVLFDESRSSAVSCAKLALEDQQSFVVVFQVAGIDSEMFRGLAMDRGGSVFLRLWDSDASGGYAFRSLRQITELPCDDPMVTDSDRPIECEGSSPGR